MSEDAERREQNILLAHAVVQGKLVALMMTLAGAPYHGARVGVGHEISEKAQQVVDAASQLRHVVVSGGEIAPRVNGCSR